MPNNALIHKRQVITATDNHDTNSMFRKSEEDDGTSINKYKLKYLRVGDQQKKDPDLKYITN